MTTRTQQQRAEVTNTPPVAGTLLPGQIYLELQDPARIWVGVPASMAASQSKLVFDASVAAQALNKTGDTATGMITFNSGINVVGSPCTIPLAAQDSSNNSAASTAWYSLQGSTITPPMDGVAVPGVSLRWARGDHVHPTDTSRAPLASPVFTGNPASTTPPQNDNSPRIATTAFVLGQASNINPIVDGTPIPGVSLLYARADHVHPTDLSRSQINISDTAPANPLPGNMWFNSLDTQLYIYYSDPTSNQWVVAVNQNGAITEAPTDGQTYGRSNSNWVPALGLAGGVLSGPLTLAADPTVALGAATKEYVDATPANHNIGRNFLHNGSILVNQRGGGAWNTSGAYTSDRWGMAFGGDTLSVSVVGLSDTDKAAMGDEAPANFVQAVFAGSATAGSASTMYQRIEQIRRLSNKTVTLSFVAKATAGTPRLGASVLQNFGTGGSPSPLVIVPLGATPPLTATPTRYTLSATLPSTAGKTWGTSGNDFSQLTFVYSDVSNSYGAGVGQQSGTVAITQMQLEIGSQATPFEKLDPRIDFSNCQRFFSVGTGYGGGYSGTTVTAIVGVTFPVTMRAAPTLTVTSNADQGPITSPAMSSMMGGFGAYFNGLTPGVASGWAINRNYTASADL